MENMGDWEQKKLIEELTQGKDLAKQLQIHLNVSSSSHETRELLVERILKSYDNALSVLKWSGSVTEIQPTGSISIVRKSESPRSLSGSPHSEDSDETKDASKKRKSMPRWTQQVQVCPGTGLEGPLDDGYNWRKYGQKDILGAKHPRGYYRCTYRNVQGCLATKQVQRSDEDPTIFDITYRGRHTCTQVTQGNEGTLLPPPSSSPPTEKLEPNTPQDHYHQNSQQTLLNFQTSLKVITNDLDTNPEKSPFSSFYFPSTSNNIEPTMVGNGSNFMGNFSPSLVSPATSSGTSNYFSAMNNNINHIFGGTHNFQTSESDLTDIVSAATTTTSATNSPTFGLDLPFSPMEFDPNFTFGNPGFFP